MLNTKYIIFFILIFAVSIGLLYVGLTQMRTEPFHIFIIYMGLSVFLAGIGVSGIIWFCCRNRCRNNRNIIYAEVSDAESESFPEIQRRQPTQTTPPSNSTQNVERPPPPQYYPVNPPLPSQYFSVPTPIGVAPPPEYSSFPDYSSGDQGNTSDGLNVSTEPLYEVPPNSSSFYTYSKSPVYSSSPTTYN